MSSRPLAATLALAASACYTGPATGPEPQPEMVTSMDDAGADDVAVNACPSDKPSACSSPMPSYSDSVERLLQTRCSPCHFPGGLADGNFDFSSYENVFAVRTPVLAEITGCAMPPATSSSGPLTTTERATLLAWLACDAPNN